MAKRKARRPYSKSPDDMAIKLLEWNPQWTRQTIEGFSVKQIVAIYHKQQQSIVKQIRESYGLPIN